VGNHLLDFEQNTKTSQSGRLKIVNVFTKYQHTPAAFWSKPTKYQSPKFTAVLVANFKSPNNKI
jgi:hypothetical protein